MAFKYLKARKTGGRVQVPCDPGNDQEIVCPGIFHREEITRDGHCQGNLFFLPGIGNH